MLESAGTQILRAGLLGAIVIVLGWVIFWLWKENKILNEKLEALSERRILDAKAVQDQLLENNTHCVTALNGTSSAMQAIKESNEEIQIALREFEREIRNKPRA